MRPDIPLLLSSSWDRRGGSKILRSAQGTMTNVTTPTHHTQQPRPPPHLGTIIQNRLILNKIKLSDQPTCDLRQLVLDGKETGRLENIMTWNYQQKNLSQKNLTLCCSRSSLNPDTLPELCTWTANRKSLPFPFF